MKIGRVYKIVSPSGKVYVGSTTMTIKKRWYHYTSLNCKKQIKLYNSLKKYGPENHVFEVVWEGNINEMLKQESIFGNLYEVLDTIKGLNCKLPKESDNIIFINEELKQKLKLINLGRKQSEETKLKRSNSNKGQIISIEQRIAISKANTGRKMTEENRIKMSKRHTGRKLSLFHKEKIGNSLKRPIIQLDLQCNFIKEWSSLKDASIFYNTSQCNISNVLNKENKTACGYKWKKDKLIN